MTATDATPSATPTLRQTAARLRFAGIVAVVVIGLALIGLISAGGVHTGTTFGPDNPAPAGAQALRSVLEQQGVAVEHASPASTTCRRATRPCSSTTPTASCPRPPGRSLLTRAPRLVVVQPGVVSLGVVLPSARTAGAPDATTASAGCSLAAARAGRSDGPERRDLVPPRGRGRRHRVLRGRLGRRPAGRGADRRHRCDAARRCHRLRQRPHQRIRQRGRRAERARARSRG